MGNLERSASQAEGSSNALEQGNLENHGERQQQTSNWEDIDPALLQDRREYVGASEPLDERERAELEGGFGSEAATNEGSDDYTDQTSIPTDAERTPEDGEPAPDHALERLHAFGNKERPRGPRPSDFGLESWNAVLEGRDPPTSPVEKVHGASVLIDPDHPDVRLTGHVHRLPPGFRPPPESGLGIHADGREVGGNMPDGHNTIYPRANMMLAEFARRFLDLPWEYSHRRK